MYMLVSAILLEVHFRGGILFFMSSKVVPKERNESADFQMLIVLE
jgi:hypothetical protein